MRTGPALFAASLVLLLAFAGCTGGPSSENRRSNPVRLGQHAGTAIVSGVDEETLVTAARCVLASAVVLYPKASNQTMGEYTLADLRPEYPNARVSSVGPALGPVYAHYRSLLTCTDVHPYDSDFALAFRSVRVERPAWDADDNVSTHATFGWVTTDHAGLSALLAERTNLSIRPLTSSVSGPVGGTAYRIGFEMPGGQDIDAVFTARVGVLQSPTHLRFWADRPERQESGGIQFFPVEIDLTASKVVQTTRFEYGAIVGRIDVVPPLFTAAGGVTQGNVTEYEDVQLRISEPNDQLLQRTWLRDWTS